MVDARDHRTPGGTWDETFTREELVRALERSAGVYAGAAEKLGVHRATVKRRVDADPELQKLCDVLVHTVNDHAKVAVIAAMKDNVRAAMWWLEHRDPDFARKVEHGGRGGGPIQYRDMSQEDYETWLASLTDEQRRAHTAIGGTSPVDGRHPVRLEEPGEGAGGHGAGEPSGGTAPEEAI